MKRIIAAIVLLAVSVTFAFISNFCVLKKFNGVSESLYDLIGIADYAKKEEIKSESERIVSEWKKNEWMFHAFVTSDLINEAERSIEILPELAKHELTEEFKTHCITAYNYVHTIYESERISKENIF